MTDPLTLQGVSESFAAFMASGAASLIIAVLILVALSTDVVKNFLAKLPIVGPLMETALKNYAIKQLEERLLEEKAINKTADRIVESNEQLIKNGRIDRPTAAAKGIKEIMHKFHVGNREAEQFLEAAVNRKNSGVGTSFRENFREGFREGKE